MEKRVQGWSRAKRIALIEGRFDDLPGLSSRGPADAG
jgi:putative endonuclease